MNFTSYGEGEAGNSSGSKMGCWNHSLQPVTHVCVDSSPELSLGAKQKQTDLGAQMERSLLLGFREHKQLHFRNGQG